MRLILFLLLFPIFIYSQQDSVVLDELTVSATRLESNATETPYSITRVDFSVKQDFLQQLSFQEYLKGVPGLFSLNANNYAQDLRISIRGFGARAAFGIRGIKLLVDGIPETTPDGQGQLDNLNLLSVDRVEILRGPASVLYGNAAGGVISIMSKPQLEASFIEPYLTLGSFGSLQYGLRSGLKTDQTDYFINASSTKSDGYRAHSNFLSYNLNARLKHRFSEKAIWNMQFNYTDSPEAQDPGSLNLESVEINREQARDRNVEFNTGEEIKQIKIGTSLQYKLDEMQEINSYAFYSNRDFYGSLPFSFGGIIDLGRNYYGVGINYQRMERKGPNRNQIKIGLELASQQDQRKRFLNTQGQAGNVTLDQTESFSTFGVYLLDELRVKKWLMSAGLRYDINQIKLEDKITVGSSASKRSWPSFNPALGISYFMNEQINFYASIRRSFETPSLSELSADPIDNSGFNDALLPASSMNYEVGLKSQLNRKWDVNLAIFYIDLKNELIPFELEEFPGRTFYRNSGKSERLGLEFAGSYSMHSNWKMNASYTWSAFTYKDFEINLNNLKGNSIPGIPKHMAFIQLQYSQIRKWKASIQARYNGSLYTNDENTVTDPGYILLDANIAYPISLGKSQLKFMAGVNNLLGVTYNDNIRINAFGGRYYEPGPGINFFGGIKLNLKS